MSAVHLDDLVSWQNEAVLVTELTQLGRAAELQDMETVTPLWMENMPALEGSTSGKCGDVQRGSGLNTDQLAYLSMAGLLLFFHYPRNRLKHAGFRKDIDSFCFRQLAF